MAAYGSEGVLVLFGILLTAEITVLGSAALPKEGIQIENVHKSPQEADKNDDDHKLGRRGLFGDWGLGSFSSSFGFSNFGNNDEGTQDFSGVSIDAGNGGTRDSFNNFGLGEQNFSEAVFNTGGKSSGTSDSFNNFGSGDQNFSGAVMNTGGETSGTRGSFNNLGSGKQSFGKGAVFNTGARIGNDSDSSQSGGWSLMNLFGTGGGNGGTRKSFNNRGRGTQNFKDAKFNLGKGTRDSFNSNGGGSINLSGATINTGTGSDDAQSFDVVNSFNGMNFSGKNNSIQFKGKAIEFSNNGLTVHCLKAGSKPISMRNNQMFIGDKLICEDVHKLSDEPSYQKSVDGSLWYTNAKVGVPMSKTEINKFDADWAVHKKEEEKKAAEKERKREQRMTAINQRMKDKAEEREKQQKLRMKAREKRAKQLSSEWGTSSFW